MNRGSDLIDVSTNLVDLQTSAGRISTPHLDYLHDVTEELISLKGVAVNLWTSCKRCRACISKMLRRLRLSTSW